MSSNFMPGMVPPEPPTHGRETAIYQEFIAVRGIYLKWLQSNKNEFWDEETKRMANKVWYLLDEIKDKLNVPF